jgi:hypothetical protein
MNRTVPVCLLTLLATAAIPVATNASELRLGVQGGVNNATLSVTNPEPWGAYSARVRPVIGAVLEVGIGSNTSIAIEPSFVGKGSKYTEHSNEFRSEIDYIELPLYAKYRLTTGSVRPYLGAGPSLGFMQRAKNNGEDIKDQVKSADASVAFGAGVEFAAGNVAFFVDGRYAVGLTNIGKSSEDPETEARNRGLQLRAGLTFRLGKH